MTARERMRNGQLFYFTEDMAAEQTQCLETLYDYNRTRPSEKALRLEILKKLLGRMGDNCHFEPPLHANWGRNTYVGHGVYANFNLLLVDDVDIHIGDHVMFGPNVVLATAGHPLEPNRRRKMAQFNLPVTIGDNVWIGANAVVPSGRHDRREHGRRRGERRDKKPPANVLAMGLPCRVVREIGEHDREFYYQDRRIDID